MVRASGAAATLLGYLLALAGLERVQGEAASRVQHLGSADLRTLITKLVQQLLLRSLGRGAAAVIELLARMICLILALLLSWSPSMRQNALTRVRAELFKHAEHLHRCASRVRYIPPQSLIPSVPQPASSMVHVPLPPTATSRALLRTTLALTVRSAQSAPHQGLDSSLWWGSRWCPSRALPAHRTSWWQGTHVSARRCA